MYVNHECSFVNRKGLLMVIIIIVNGFIIIINAIIINGILFHGRRKKVQPCSDVARNLHGRPDRSACRQIFSKSY